MSRLSDRAARALLALEPERAHRVAILGLKAGLGPRGAAEDDPILATHLCGLKLPNPVGLAAGFDKNAEAPAALLKAGFGFVECGTVTPRAQAGNPRPRLFRLAEDAAVINRLGFNNQGLEAFASRLNRPRVGVVGANIGANRDSDDKIADYVTGFQRLAGLADYFTINISSPNTPGLRDLQAGEALQELLGRLTEARVALASRTAMFLKVAPDLSAPQIETIAEAVASFGLDAVVVGNTTLSRAPDLKSRWRTEAGGLSGAPLLGPSTRVLGLFRDAARGRFPLVGVGGVGSGADAYAKIRAGAAAVQLYSALVFRGPGLVSEICTDLAARLRAEGFRTVEEAVGAPI
jgi:dihydroorotate dehydrogenase